MRNSAYLATILIVVALDIHTSNSQDLQEQIRLPKFDERINEFVWQWQQLPDRRSYWAHIAMDNRGPGRQAWFEYLYRISLSNSPESGRRIRVDGVKSQHSVGTIQGQYHDLVLLGKHVSAIVLGPGSVSTRGVSRKVLDTQDKDAVVTSATDLYAFDPFWVSLGSFTTVKRSQNVAPVVQAWSTMHVAEEKLRADGTYEVLVISANGLSATEVIFAKEPVWMPIEVRSYFDVKNQSSPMPATKVQRKHVQKWTLVSHTKTEWTEVKSSEDQKRIVPKKFIMYQLIISVNHENDVVIDLDGWRFDKEVPARLFSEEEFETTVRSFELSEGQTLFKLHDKEVKKTKSP